VTKKLEISDPVMAELVLGATVEFTIAGANVPAALAGTHVGIITAIDAEFGAPSTLSFSIGSYGTAWT
jgi:hypothetical protein